MPTKIERSTGLYTGYMGYFCGNGYEGLTKELDDTVKREAELLTTTLNLIPNLIPTYKKERE